MVTYRVYSDAYDSRKQCKSVVRELNSKSIDYKLLNKETKLSEISELGREHIKAVVVNDIDSLNTIIKDAVAILLKEVAKDKDVIIIISSKEYNDTNSKLAHLNRDSKE